MSGVGSSSVPMGQVTGERDTKSGISKLGWWGRRPEDRNTKVLLPWGAPKVLWNVVEMG